MLSKQRVPEEQVPNDISPLSTQHLFNIIYFLCRDLRSYWVEYSIIGFIEWHLSFLLCVKIEQCDERDFNYVSTGNENMCTSMKTERYSLNWRLLVSTALFLFYKMLFKLVLVKKWIPLAVYYWIMRSHKIILAFVFFMLKWES